MFLGDYMKKDFIRIVLTGGPCAGKSMALDAIDKHLKALGCNVFRINEVATQFILAGFNPPQMTLSQLFSFQVSLLRQQIQTEDNLADIALNMDLRGPIVFLCDRGALDSSAFLDNEMWYSLLGEYNWSEIKLGGRYDGVIHLATTADGALEHYSLANNPARSETPELAREIDNRLRKIWVGHEHYRYIDNASDFSEKLNRVLLACTNIVGIPHSLEIERKFLVKGIDKNKIYNLLADNKLIYDTVNIEQTYLDQRYKPTPPDRVRKRSKNGIASHYATSKRSLGSVENFALIEDEYKITAKEYYEWLQWKDVESNTIHKDRICAIYKSIVIEIDCFKKPEGLNFVLVESEVDKEEDMSKTDIIQELFKKFEVIDVTRDKDWKNAIIAKEGFKNV